MSELGDAVWWLGWVGLFVCLLAGRRCNNEMSFPFSGMKLLTAAVELVILRVRSVSRSRQPEWSSIRPQGTSCYSCGRI